jgi:hypothetical protein
LIQLAVDGATLVCQARIYLNDRNDAPCPRCAFGDAEERFMLQGQRFSCEGGTAPTRPTTSISALCSLAGALAAILTLRHTLRLGEPLADGIYEYCGYTTATWIGRLGRRPQCPQEHTPWTVVRLDGALSSHSLRQIAVAGTGHFDGAMDFEIDRWTWAITGLCAGGHALAIGRFMKGNQVQRVCQVCGAEVVVPQVHSLRRVSAEILADSADVSLSQLGPPSVQSVLVRRGTDTWLVMGTDHGREVS